VVDHDHVNLVLVGFRFQPKLFLSAVKRDGSEAAKTMRSAVRAVLKDEKYRCAARQTQAAILRVDGLQRAADIIEHALKIGVETRADAEA
jgi:hypothetical protein